MVNAFEASIPDSQLCQQATALVKKVSPDFLCQHCLRTYFFGQQLAVKQNLKVDAELLYLGAIMHDLGLSDTFDSGQRYEVDGADAAKKFVLKHGLSEEKAEVVWDAIALHTSIGIASRKRPEIALVHLGASIDIFGIGIDELDSDIVHQIFETYPRQNLTDAVTDLFIGQIKSKPEVVPFTWLAEVGRSCIHRFRTLSYTDMVKNSPF